MPQIIDKALVNAVGLAMTVSGDLMSAEDDDATMQEAQNRLVAKQGTWFYDAKFGNTLHDFMRNSSPYLLTDDRLLKFVQDALQPMLNDGRITQIIDAKVIDRETTSVSVYTSIQIGVNKGTISFVVKF